MDYAQAGDLLDYVEAGGLRIARALHDFVTAEAIPGTGIDPAAFWQGFGALVRELAPRNKALLEQRDALQQQIDDWHRAHRRPADRPATLSAVPARDRLPAAGAGGFRRRHGACRCRRSPASPGRSLSCR